MKRMCIPAATRHLAPNHQAPSPLWGGLGRGWEAGTRLNHPSLVLRTNYRTWARSLLATVLVWSLPVKGRGPEQLWSAMLLLIVTTICGQAFAAPVASFDDI